MTAGCYQKGHSTTEVCYKIHEEPWQLKKWVWWAHQYLVGNPTPTCCVKKQWGTVLNCETEFPTLWGSDYECLMSHMEAGEGTGSSKIGPWNIGRTNSAIADKPVARLTPQTSPSHVRYHVIFGRFASKSVRINIREPQNWGTLGPRLLAVRAWLTPYKYAPTCYLIWSF